MNDIKWLSWATELQSIAQSALAYCKDPYDIERFHRIREISAEILAHQSDLPLEKVKNLFCCESGYQTPKLDCRGVVFQDDKILLVQENNGLWTLPGGWMDIGLTVGENTAKEVREEAGLEVIPRRLIAVQDWVKNNHPANPIYSICKVFVECELVGGAFVPNVETLASGWFSLDELPPLLVEKSTVEQLELCFKAQRQEYWETVFD